VVAEALLKPIRCWSRMRTWCARQIEMDEALKRAAASAWYDRLGQRIMNKFCQRVGRACCGLACLVVAAIGYITSLRRIAATHYSATQSPDAERDGDAGNKPRQQKLARRLRLPIFPALCGSDSHMVEVRYKPGGAAAHRRLAGRSGDSAVAYAGQ